MKEIFTKMASILIGLASMSVLAMGQSVEKVQFDEVSALTQGMELRSYTDCYKGDSAITFTGAGVKVEKKVFRDYISVGGIGVGGIYDLYRWESNTWVLEWPRAASQQPALGWSAPMLQIPSLGSWRYNWNFTGKNVKPVYNVSGLLASLSVSDSGAESYYEFSFTYNKDGHPLQIEMYFFGSKTTFTYLYDAQGNGISFEYLGSTGAKLDKMTCQYDTQGRPTLLSSYEGHETLQQWVLDWYEIYYYSEGRMPTFSIANNTPVTDSNKGLFDFIFNLPADSLQSGSFTVQLPSGFTLDAANTKLAALFDAFTLSVTKQDDNAWLFEIKPKSTRNAALRSDEANKTLAKIAYTVAGAVKRGTYDISIGNIQFETPGGNMIPEPAITVPVDVNRWGVGNESIADVANVWSSVGRLHVRTSQSVTLNIYTLSGTLLKRQTVAAGETAISLPQGTYIVQAGKTAKKTVIR